ncbi:MAG: amino acid ABC transporter substrate-binding protein, partial [Betaproteobacteria bacterium]
MITKRTLCVAVIASLASLTLSTAALAQKGKAETKEDIVLGGSIPMTGVFAFAGIGVDQGIK